MKQKLVGRVEEARQQCDLLSASIANEPSASDLATMIRALIASTGARKYAAKTVRGSSLSPSSQAHAKSRIPVPGHSARTPAKLSGSPAAFSPAMAPASAMGAFDVDVAAELDFHEDAIPKTPARSTAARGGAAKTPGSAFRTPGVSRVTALGVSDLVAPATPTFDDVGLSARSWARAKTPVAPKRTPHVLPPSPTPALAAAVAVASTVATVAPPTTTTLPTTTATLPTTLPTTPTLPTPSSSFIAAPTAPVSAPAAPTGPTGPTGPFGHMTEELYAKVPGYVTAQAPLSTINGIVDKINSSLSSSSDPSFTQDDILALGVDRPIMKAAVLALLSSKTIRAHRDGTTTRYHLP